MALYPPAAALLGVAVPVLAVADALKLVPGVLAMLAGIWPALGSAGFDGLYAGASLNVLAGFFLPQANMLLPDLHPQKLSTNRSTTARGPNLARMARRTFALVRARARAKGGCCGILAAPIPGELPRP